MNRTKSHIYESPRFEQELAELLKSHHKQSLPRNDLTVAAVLCALYYKDGLPHVLLTKRSEKVVHHKGEISFPGGKMDLTDASLLECALRETHEEIGVAPADVTVIGELDEFYTVATSYLVAPFVGFVPYPYEFSISQREIDQIIGVPLEVFFDPSRRKEEIWTVHGEPLEVVFYHWKEHTIWGATARILKHFVELMQQWDNGSSRIA